jgi:putative endonuclease
MARDYNFWVYIITNRSHLVLYIGVTNRLSRPTWEHREGAKAGFASKYQCKKLIYYEHYRSRSHDAVIRVYDEAGNVIETHEHKGDFKVW